MRKRDATRLLKTLILTMLVLACAAGCVNKRPYAASRSVLTFEDAVWAEVDGELYLVSARFKAEKELTLEDIGYNFRRGAVLTPGFLAELMQAESEELP